MFLDLISDVDHSDYLGGLLFKNRRNGQCYNFTGLAGGSKMVMVCVMYPQFEFPITHIGANCLPYLVQLQDTHDAHFYGTWNIMYSAECGGFSCPSLYLDDYDVVVDDYLELQKYLDDWLEKNPKPAFMRRNYTF